MSKELIQLENKIGTKFEYEYKLKGADSYERN